MPPARPTTLQPRSEEEPLLAKPEWGSKRICPSCGARYYDLMHDPIVCPKCSTAFDPEALLRARRARPAAPEEKALEPVVADYIGPDLETAEVEPGSISSATTGSSAFSTGAAGRARRAR